MTQNSNTESEISDQEYMEVANSAGARPKTKVGDPIQELKVTSLQFPTPS